jgi:methylated-DNA-[protein]-cysteine S-methyltransferase
MDERQLETLREALGTPSDTTVSASRRRVERWFGETAPLIQWDVIESPLGLLYVAVSAEGLCAVDFGVTATAFLSQLDPLARSERNAATLAPFVTQLQTYFTDPSYRFELPLDLGRLTPFQATVLQAARNIPSGSVRTYGQIAQAIGSPRASRAVGQALGRNPVPIVIPCHRVIASDGSLGGYSGGGGLQSKRFLLGLEGAI